MAGDAVAGSATGNATGNATGSATGRLKKSSKDLLAEAVKELMQRRELEDISVESILELSGVSRATFYKYFMDKRQLAEYVFLKELANVLFVDYDRPIYECETEILHYLDANRTFYRNALKSPEFREAWLRAAYNADIDRLTRRYGDKGASQEDIVLFANLLSRVLVDATWLWVTDPDGRTAEDLAMKLAIFVEHGTSGLFERHDLVL